MNNSILSCIKFISHVIFEEHLDASHVAKTTQGLKAWLKKNICFTHEVLGFSLLF
jgi:hypothetical protein